VPGLLFGANTACLHTPHFSRLRPGPDGHLNGSVYPPQDKANQLFPPVSSARSNFIVSPTRQRQRRLLRSYLPLIEGPKNNNIQLLTALADSEDEEDSYYRFLVNGTSVKYITMAPGIITGDYRTFAPDVLEGLPPFPSGSWAISPRRAASSASSSRHRQGQGCGTGGSRGLLERPEEVALAGDQARRH
jgi:hypothetical protein